MPRIVRRSPESEKGAIYGYGDLLKDIMRKISKGATREVERVTGGGLSNEELLEMATAGGGMLKVAGVGKLSAGLLKRMGEFKRVIGESAATTKFQPTRKVFYEALKIPQKEYSRIEDINWRISRTAHRGEFDPALREISLNPTKALLTTPWHEFVHARQWDPERLSRLPSGRWESEAASQLMSLRDRLSDYAKRLGMTGMEFYKKYSPTERHARGVADVAVKYPGEFEKIYKHGLQQEVKWSRERMLELFNILYPEG